MNADITERKTQEYMKSLTVLYIEDEKDSRKLCSDFLSRIVGVLVTAHNGAEGLEAWRRHKPDIIITDIQMPVMDGLAMLQEIRRFDLAVPVIILTAFEEPKYLKRSIELGVSGYVVKPLHLSRFTEALLKCARNLLVEYELRQAQIYAENIVETVREPLVVLDSRLKILTANHNFYVAFKVSVEDTIGNFIYDLGNRQWDIPKLRVLLEEILPKETVLNGYEVEHDFPDIGRKTILLNARQIFREEYGSHIILLAMEDITERKLAERTLQKKNKELGCLYNIISLSNDPGISFDELLKCAVMSIPLAWQFPDITEAYIEIGVKSFRTAHFEETPWMLVHEITEKGNKVGKVAVCYLEERAFLPEELTFLKAIAEKLGLIVMREVAKETITQLVVTDELTGLNNRRFFNTSLSKTLSAARRHRQPLSLISIDIDHFKKVNDTFGHFMGDRVLKEFSLLLKMMVRVEDIACRWGGEEFIVLLPNTTSEAAVILANRICCGFEQYPRTTTPVVTASFGVAQLQEGEDEDDLIRRIDAALYQAKHEGRNRVVTACDVPLSSIMMTKTTAEAAWDLRQRAEEQLQSDVVMHIQPRSPLEQEKQHHELRVHQIELEMQNQELRLSQEQLNAEMVRYCDLYDMAPAGYLTINDKGLIAEANLAAATMLCISHSVLLNQRFSRHILVDDQDAYYIFRKECCSSSQPHVRKLRLVRADGSPFWVRLYASSVKDGELWVSFNDISAEEQDEEALQVSRRDLKATLDVTADGILSVNNEGKILFSSKRFAKSWRIPQELIDSGDESRLLTHVLDQLSDPDAFLLEVQRLYASSENSSDVIEFKDGRFFERYSFPLHTEGTQPNGRVWSFRDITERKQTDELLKESEERFRNMANSAPVLIWISGSDKLYHWFNQVWLDFTGRTMEQEVGNGWAEGVHPDDLDRCLETYISAFDNHQPFSMEYRLCRGDGEYRWLIDNGVPIYKENAFTGYIGSCVDITDQKIVEKKLFETTALLTNITNSNPDAIFSKDLDGRYKLFNTAAARFIGKSADEVLGKKDYDLFPPDVAEKLIEKDRKTIKEGNVIAFEETITNTSGLQASFLVTKAPLINPEGEVYGIIGVSRDITERKQAERELSTLRELSMQMAEKRTEEMRKSERFTNDIIDSLSANIAVLDATGKIIKINRSWKRFYEENCGTKSISNFVGTDYLAACRASIDSNNDHDAVAAYDGISLVLRGKMEYFSMEYHCHSPEEQSWFLMTVTRLSDSQGVVVSHSNITECKLAENALAITEKHDVTEGKNIKEQLLQSQKMESIGQLAGGLAHDINNFLSVINGYCGLLQMKVAQDEQLSEYAAKIITASGRAGELTHSMMAFGRKQVMKLQHQNLNLLLTTVGSFIKRIIHDNIIFTLSLRDDSLSVNVDTVQIEQALLNLATNARDAMPEGGTFIIDTVSRRMDKPYIATHGFGTVGSYAVITVTDSGHGMDAETIQKVFDPFFTTKEVGKGTGLGLSMVMEIIKQHGGFIDLHSQPGTGSVFQLYLPLVDEGKIAVSTKTDVQMEMGSGTILVAEDDPDTRVLIDQLLVRAGYSLAEVRPCSGRDYGANQ